MTSPTTPQSISDLADAWPAGRAGFATDAGVAVGTVGLWVARGRMPAHTRRGDAVVRVWQNLCLAAKAHQANGRPDLSFVTMDYLEALSAGADIKASGHGGSIAAAGDAAPLTKEGCL